MVKTLAQDSGGLGFDPWPSQTKDFKILWLVAVPLSVWYYGSRAKTGQPGVSIM